MELFDSHAHYDDEKFNEDRDFIINEIYKSGVTKFVSAGYSLDSSKKGLEIAQKYDYVFTTSGISPNDIPEIKEILDCSPSTARAVMTKLRDMKVVKAVNGKGKGKYVFIE